MTRGELVDDFSGDRLDRDVWIPHYLPQWSSRAESAATFAVAGSELRLSIPPEQPLWCPDQHPPLRVSGVQSGVSSGPVGSTVGQQPVREGAVVREHQPPHWGWTPHHGRIEARARMELSPRSMASVWLIGLEDQPDRCGEICVFEVFGDAIGVDADGTATAEVGMGTKPFRDPALTGDFDAPRLAIDVRDHHDYAVEWRPGRVDWFVDGIHVRTVHEAPAYPVQAMVAVFDFPDKAAPTDPPGHAPLLAVDRIAGAPVAG